MHATPTTHAALLLLLLRYDYLHFAPGVIADTSIARAFLFLGRLQQSAGSMYITNSVYCCVDDWIMYVELAM
jgi:hypothetical protein